MLVKTCGGDDDPDKREGWEQRPERDCNGDLWDDINGNYHDFHDLDTNENYYDCDYENDHDYHDYHDDDQDMEFPGRPLTLASPVLAHRIGQELLLEWEKFKEDASLNKTCEREYSRTSRSRKKLTRVEKTYSSRR